MEQQRDELDGPGSPQQRMGLDGAMADVVRAARHLLADAAREPAEAPALGVAVARAAAAASAGGLHADALASALDAALTRAGEDMPPEETEGLRAAVAALVLRAHLGGVSSVE